MKKILFLTQLPPPVHGASVVNKAIRDSKLINSHFETRYVDISPAKEMVDIGKFSFSKLGLTFLILFQALAAYIKFKPNLVYLTLSPHGLAFYKDGFLALTLKVLGARMVFHMHGKGVANAAGGSGLKYRIYRAVFRNVDIIHLSESLFSDLDGIRDETRSISAVPNGVEPVACNTNPSSIDKVTFVYLSNLVRTKGADVLIRASALLPQEMQRKFQVKIIGKPSDDEYFSEIESLIDENAYGNVTFLGPKYGKDKDAELCSADVFVLPTRFKNECFPLTILEAMSAKLAVISTCEGAIPDIVDHGVTGELLEACTEESIARAMLRFISDPGYANACGAAGLAKYAANYTMEEFEKNIIAALNEIISLNLARGNQ